MENWGWLVDTFTFIGMIVCILITLIAIVWLTCFFVKLLVKTFNVRVGKSYEIMVEDITKKSEAKKERNEIKRKAAFEQKMELLNMKLESKARVHEMKKQKLDNELNEKENKQKIKLFGEKVVENFVETKEPEKSHEDEEKESKQTSKKPKQSKTKENIEEKSE